MGMAFEAGIRSLTHINRGLHGNNGNKNRY